MTGMQRRLFRLANRVASGSIAQAAAVLGNKARGLPEDPQWFRNLRATDTAGVDLRDQHHDVAVRVLEGEERDDAFAQVLRENPSFGAYEGKAGRPMPVAHLTPR